jgi:hypothetical protein
VAADFWEEAAQRDPLFAILSDPSRRGRRWDLESFFETGRREISLLLYQLQRLGQPLVGGRRSTLAAASAASRRRSRRPSRN